MVGEIDFFFQVAKRILVAFGVDSSFKCFVEYRRVFINPTALGQLLD